jgi:ribonucleotide reductase alpha subunit
MQKEISEYNEKYCFSEILPSEFLEKYMDVQPEWGFNNLGFIVYKRTYARDIIEKKLKEEWWQTVARSINGAQKIGAGYTTAEAQRLYDLIFNLKCSFGGRMLWQLGTSTVDRFGLASLLNCWFSSMREPNDFCFVFEHLMLGGGVGFSVKREDIHELPKVKQGVTVSHELSKGADFIVPDSREGWVELLRKVLDSFFNGGKSFTYSTIVVRGKGEPIKGFGGTASGPQPLIEGIQKIVKVLQSRGGKKLRSVDVLDINNIIGSVVVAGNVRRSAEVAIGDPDDYLYIRAKNWSEGKVPNWRAMSNNSIYADSFKHISSEVWNIGYKIDKKTGMARGEPYGFMNLPLSQKNGRLGEKRKDNCEGGNPCVTSDTWALTESGPRQVKDLIGKEFKVIHNGKPYNVTSNGFVKTGNKKVYKVKTNNGYSLRLTDNHKLLKPNGDWLELKDLAVGDSITIENNEEFEWGSKNEFKKGWLLGNLVGDGTFDNSRAILSYRGESRESSHKTATAFLKDCFCPRQDIGKTSYDSDPVRVSSVELKKLANSLGIFKKDKFDLSEIEKSSSSLVKGFISGLMDADGSIQGNLNKGASIRLGSISIEMLESVQRMLLNLGIVSKIYEDRIPERQQLMPNGYGGKSFYQCKALHEIVISGESIFKFKERIGFLDEIKLEKLNLIVASYKRLPNRQKFSDEIISIELDGQEDVYDLTVDEVHCFSANGIVAHNCMEITLADGEACNLCEIFLNRIESQEEMEDCALLLYKTQKAIWTLPCLYQKTEDIVKKNMRIGLGVTGICQSLNTEWLDKTYKKLRAFDAEWSKERNWPESIKLTTVKPSGTLSLLAGSTPGVHPAYSRFYIRRVRMSSDDSLVATCRDMGYHVEFVKNFDGSEDHSTVVVEFLCEAGENTILAKNMSAVDQLNLVKTLQTHWADNSVSVTVYYKEEELPEIKKWMAENYENGCKTLSFLLHSEHGFSQAPYEEISEQDYISKVSKLNSNIRDISIAGSEMLSGVECEGGACPIR